MTNLIFMAGLFLVLTLINSLIYIIFDVDYFQETGYVILAIWALLKIKEWLQKKKNETHP